MDQQYVLLFYFFARDEAEGAARSTIDSLLALLKANDHGRRIVCYVGIDAIGAKSLNNGDEYPSGDWRMYRIRDKPIADLGSPFEVEVLSKAASPQDLATGVRNFLARADEDLGGPVVPRTIVLSVSSHGIPAFGLSSRQFSQVANHIASQPEDVIKKQWAEIVKAIGDSGEFKGDQKQPALSMLQEIGLDNFVDAQMPDSKIRDELGLLERCFTFPSDFQKIGVGVMACHSGPAIREGLALEQAIQEESDENSRSNEESKPAPTWDSLSIRHFRILLQKNFRRNRLDLILLHNCSLGMLDTFYELRDVAKYVIAANTTISGALSPRKWFLGIPTVIDVRKWCEHILFSETDSVFGFRSLVGVRNDDKAWSDTLRRVRVYVDKLRILRQCDAFQQMRNSCTNDEPTTVSIDRLESTVNSCVANPALLVAVHSLLLQTPPNLPSIYLPTCGTHPEDSYRRPMHDDDTDGFSFLEEVAWDSVVRLPKG